MHIRFRTRAFMNDLLTFMMVEDAKAIALRSGVAVVWTFACKDMDLMVTDGMLLRADKPRYLGEIWHVFPIRD